MAKKNISMRDLIPLSYYLKRYGTGYAGDLLSRSLLIDGYVLLGALYLSNSLAGDIKAGASVLMACLLARVGFLSAHEIGYFVNDYWSEGRERRAAGDFAESSSGGAGKVILVGVFTRLLTIFALIKSIEMLVDEASSRGVVYVIAQGAAIFALHNILLFPWRTLSFFLLYLTNYSVAVAFSIPSESKQGLYTYMTGAAVLSFAYTAKYFFDRVRVRGRIGRILSFGPYFLRYNNFICRLALFLLVIALLLNLVLDIKFELKWLVYTIFYILCIDLLFIMLRFGLRLTSSLKARGAIFHVHTNLSHDGEMECDTITQLAQRSKVRQVFIADHAEDFTDTLYAKLQERCSKASSSHTELIPGLEYDIRGQHFLCYGLAHYIKIDGNSLESIPLLQASCKTFVWAHPHFKQKKILSC